MRSIERDYFERLYTDHPDPWNFRESRYERDKYAATLAALDRPRYDRALELGCSIGVLTRQLASCCDTVVAVDTSAKALQAARRHCAGAAVEFVQAHLPDGEWGADFDLVVLSEILYYLDEEAIDALARKLRPLALPGAHYVAVHWTGPTDYPLSGDAAMDAFEASIGASSIQCTRHRHYRLDRWKLD